MKITYTAAALLSIAAVLPAVGQMEVNPDRFTEQGSSVILVGQRNGEVSALQKRLEGYEEQLRVEFELVENLRQDAISAGIQGDGAQAYIDLYRDEQVRAERMRAALSPQIEQVRATIAALSRTNSQASLPSQKADSRKPKKNSDLMASQKAVNLRAAK